MSSSLITLFILLMITVVSNFSVLAASKPGISLAKHRSNLSQQQEMVQELKTRLSHLEKQLGDDNRDLLKMLKVGENLEREIAFLTEKGLVTKSELAKNKERAIKEYHHLLIYLVDSNQDASTLLLKRTMAQRLQREISQLKRVEQETQKVQVQLSMLTSTLQGNLHRRERLSFNLSSLEQEKNQTAQSYLSAVKRRSELREGLADAKKRQVRSGKLTPSRKVKSVPALITTKLAPPIDKFIGQQHKKKGITYRFMGVRPVMATGDGEIVYLGELSTYGNLLIINHGNKTRSILLGEFTPKVKKGKRVRQGELIGYTTRLASTVGQEGQLYFEVRQGEMIQNTSLLLDRQQQAKNNLPKKNQAKKVKNKNRS
ncbi:MAG: peptidoglycan DD-metalloendopeptidase family protein [Bdellovibrionales bacterium]|nr:peptidoglycan DD-metalloendopeptidase family protein [Bdellovibrionales bacterium]